MTNDINLEFLINYETTHLFKIFLFSVQNNFYFRVMIMIKFQKKF